MSQIAVRCCMRAVRCAAASCARRVADVRGKACSICWLKLSMFPLARAGIEYFLACECACVRIFLVQCHTLLRTRLTLKWPLAVPGRTCTVQHNAFSRAANCANASLASVDKTVAVCACLLSRACPWRVSNRHEPTLATLTVHDARPTRSCHRSVCHDQHPLGATVIVPAGTWVTGPFNLTSNMTLHVSVGATIAGSTDPAV